MRRLVLLATLLVVIPQTASATQQKKAIQRRDLRRPGTVDSYGRRPPFLKTGTSEAVQRAGFRDHGRYKNYRAIMGLDRR